MIKVINVNQLRDLLNESGKYGKVSFIKEISTSPEVTAPKTRIGWSGILNIFFEVDDEIEENLCTK